MIIFLRRFTGKFSIKIVIHNTISWMLQTIHDIVYKKNKKWKKGMVAYTCLHFAIKNGKDWDFTIDIRRFQTQFSLQRGYIHSIYYEV